MVFPALGFPCKNMSLVVGFYFRLCWFIFLPIYLLYTLYFNNIKKERIFFLLNLQLLIVVIFPTEEDKERRICP